MLKTLDQFVVGECGVVKNMTAEGKIKRRLLDMGITNGTQIFLRKKAPLGDPLEITVRGYELTLRKAEGACIVMEIEK